MQVVGIIRPSGRVGFQDIDQIAVAPLRALSARINPFDEISPNHLTNIVVRTKTTERLSAAKAAAVEFFDAQRKSVVGSDAIQIAESAEEIGFNHRVFYGFVMVVIVAVLVMLVSVSFRSILSARAKEINLSMLIGSSRGFVVLQYVSHFVALFVLSATPSVVLATLTARATGAALNLPIEIDVKHVLAAQILILLLMAVIVGAMAFRASSSARYVLR